MRDTFDLSRNHYDRVGHLALGMFPCFTVREAGVLAWRRFGAAHDRSMAARASACLGETFG